MEINSKNNDEITRSNKHSCTLENIQSPKRFKPGKFKIMTILK